MAKPSNTEIEIKSWLKAALYKDVENFTIKILGNSEKGDGYVGDIIFVRVNATSNGLAEEYNLVLKCGKKSKVLREKSPVKEAFLNEIYFYNVVLPAFIQFQKEKKIENIFDNVPQCYGTLVNENTEVIIFENLKSLGYDMCDKKKPLTRKHVDMVIKEYAKLHAISIAMENQNPEKFTELRNSLNDIFKKFMEVMNMEDVMEKIIEEIYDLLRDELDENILLKWKHFKLQCKFILHEMAQNISGIRVILHGDCWNNNFLFTHKDGREDQPSKVVLIDWQQCKYSSPILDISFFLFTCISQTDIEDLITILQYYHSSLTEYLALLGNDCNKLYPLHQFLSDWKDFSKYGILIATLIMKMVSTDRQEVIDLAQAAESNEPLNSVFSYQLRDKSIMKNRMRHIVKYVVENDLI